MRQHGREAVPHRRGLPRQLDEGRELGSTL